MSDQNNKRREEAARRRKRNLSPVQSSALNKLAYDRDIVWPEELGQQTFASLLDRGLATVHPKQGCIITAAGLKILELYADRTLCLRSNPSLPLSKSVLQFLGKTTLRIVKKHEKEKAATAAA